MSENSLENNQRVTSTLDAQEKSYQHQVEAIKAQYKQRILALEKEQEIRLKSLESTFKRQRAAMKASMNHNSSVDPLSTIKH